MRLLREYFNRVSYELINIIIPLVPLTYLARVLGANGLGIQAWTMAFVEFFAILLISPTSLLGEWELFSQRENKRSIINTFWNVMLLRVLLTGLALGLFFALTYVWANQTWVVQHYTHELTLSAWLILGVFLDISWLYQGIGHRRRAVLQSSFSKIFMFLFILIFVKTSSDVDAYIIMVALVQIIGNGFLWVRLPKYIWGKVHINLVPYIRPLFAMVLSVIGFQLFTLLGRLMMPMFSINTEAWVGYYDSALKLLGVAIVVVISIGITMLPRFYQKYNHAKFNVIQTHLRNSLENVSAFGAAFMFGTAGIAVPFIMWFMGSDYIPAAHLMIGLSPLILLLGWTTVIGGQYLRVSGRMQLVNISMVIGLVVNVILNFILIPHYAAYGAVASIVLAHVVIFGLQMFFARDMISFSMLFGVSWKYLMAGAFMLVSVYAVRLFVGAFPTYTVLEIFVGTLVYVIALSLIHSRLIKEAKKVVHEYWRFFKRGWKWKLKI